MKRQATLIPSRVMLRAAASIWGVAMAIACFPLVVRPAPPGQLPGITRVLNVDANAPFRFFALLVILPLAAPWVLRPFLRLLERDDTRRWARNAAEISFLVPLWFVIIEANLAWALIPTAVAIASRSSQARRRFLDAAGHHSASGTSSRR